ncbi:PREDICTED: zinc finger A20 and AN1 domain-containing stress-associated protein 7-like [Ipomoea nil]|uniref:zinc finger A20 and AN1 domain-containing stress-associated protein 7-like n=1 Tax=Ipomoea nil TaxID=35883 RepID=UPI0009016C1C|nr:PREDICTED: zinc finger A20 and AN1 domain-containing stress-associated protein 7-like [Ipomoea nil]XP_019156523.1 PREDICTED: zinc finger A20 and AN1 domain-containing stress-associated protein 7-like [Ipomoea nil]XP_019156524.1 PREDICTED: zinc finger A20 and AN1 domain-containing stress-associated protein 7-like [Ipomoea nil]
MGSDGNKMKSGGTGFPPPQTALCANGCGFFGTAATMGLCTRCFRELRMKERRQEDLAKAAVEQLALYSRLQPDSPPSSTSASVVTAEQSGRQAAPPNRCDACKKKVRVMGFECRCGRTFCGIHRYPEKHDCTFDFKAQGRDAIAKANPMVKADKIQRF